MTDTLLTLCFSHPHSPELSTAEFRSPTLGGPRFAVRGKTEGAFRGAGTFQWTAAVKGLCTLAVRSVLHEVDSLTPAIIQGARGSAAASLDYAVSKGPTWLTELFGAETNGDSTAKRLFRRSNPNMKRPGPVVISINPHLLPSRSIVINMDGHRLSAKEQLHSLLQNLENPNSGSSRQPDHSQRLRLIVNS